MSIGVALNNLRVVKNGRAILNACSVNAWPGELLAIIGPNGAGKSMALKCLAGVETSWTSVVHVGDSDVKDMRHNERAAKIAYLPQTFTAHWELTVRELIALGQSRGSGTYQFGNLQPDGRQMPSLPSLDLDQFMDRQLGSLSGGERARATLAWALASRPPVLIADEPIASLDPSHQLQTMSFLRSIRQQITVIVVLHDLNLALRFADRIAVIADGACAALTAPADLIRSDTLQHVFGIGFDHFTTSWGEGLSPR